MVPPLLHVTVWPTLTVSVSGENFKASDADTVGCAVATAVVVVPLLGEELLHAPSAVISTKTNEPQIAPLGIRASFVYEYGQTMRADCPAMLLQPEGVHYHATP